MWAICLAHAGCEVHLLTAARNRPSIEAYLLANPCPQLHPYYMDVPLLPLQASSSSHYLGSQFLMLRKARSLAKTISFDIVHHVSYGSVHRPTPLWRLGVPTIFGPVGGGQTAPPSLLSYFGADAKKERLRTAFTRLLPHLPFFRSRIRRMRLILAANSETRQLVEASGCRNVSLMCDSGSREDHISQTPRSGQASSPARLLWVGSFVPRKGLALALDCLARTRNPIHLTLVGAGMPPHAVRRMIHERGLDDRVHWAGAKIPFLEVREAYASHDALFFTSLRDSFGAQNMEAMSAGLPLIALNLSGVRDFVPEDASIKINLASSPDQTVDDLAAALDRFFELPMEQRNQMSLAAWKCARNLTWSRRAAHTISLYEEIIQAKTRVHA